MNDEKKKNWSKANMCMIPARIGSTRLKMKNLALLNGRPLIAYAIIAAQQAGVFDRIVINSDSTVFQIIAERYGVEFYKRPEHLGSSTTKSDDVVLDFMQNHSSEVVVWVNPISPLQTGNEIKQVVDYFKKEQLDSLITKDEQVHCIHQGKPLISKKPANLNKHRIWNLFSHLYIPL